MKFHLSLLLCLLVIVGMLTSELSASSLRASRDLPFETAETCRYYKDGCLANCFQASGKLVTKCWIYEKGSSYPRKKAKEFLCLCPW